MQHQKSANYWPLCWSANLATILRRRLTRLTGASLAPDVTSQDPFPLCLVYFSGIFIPKICGDMWGFGVHSILLNLLKYTFPKILYHDREFLIYPKIH
jgi:hypothetical protein